MKLFLGSLASQFEPLTLTTMVPLSQPNATLQKTEQQHSQGAYCCENLLQNGLFMRPETEFIICAN